MLFRSLGNIKMLLEGAMLAHGRVGLMLNVHSDNLKAVLAVLPALKQPTISQLSETGWIAAIPGETRRMGTVGRPLPYHALAIVDGDGHRVARRAGAEELHRDPGHAGEREADPHAAGQDEEQRADEQEGDAEVAHVIRCAGLPRR